MFKNPELGIGKILFPELEMAKKLNIDLKTFRKYEKEINENQSTPILTIVPTKVKDFDSGLPLYERVYNFEAYHNLLSLKFQQIDSELQDKVSKKDYEMLLRKNEMLEKRLHELELQINATDAIIL